MLFKCIRCAYPRVDPLKYSIGEPRYDSTPYGSETLLKITCANDGHTTFKAFYLSPKTEKGVLKLSIYNSVSSIFK